MDEARERLPEDFIREHATEGEASIFRGRLIGEMDREELMAIIGFLDGHAARDRRDHEQAIDRVFSLFDR